MMGEEELQEYTEPLLEITGKVKEVMINNTQDIEWQLGWKPDPPESRKLTRRVPELMVIAVM